jgi:hypothetical protein
VGEVGERGVAWLLAEKALVEAEGFKVRLNDGCAVVVGWSGAFWRPAESSVRIAGQARFAEAQGVPTYNRINISTSAFRLELYLLRHLKVGSIIVREYIIAN